MKQKQINNKIEIIPRWKNPKAKLKHNAWKRKYYSNKINKQKHQNLCNIWRIKNLDKKRKHQKKYILLHPEVEMAHKESINIGISPNCDICHLTNNLQRHHWRYDKPLLVNTLCQECHNIQHIKHFNESCFGRY